MKLKTLKDLKRYSTTKTRKVRPPLSNDYELVINYKKLKAEAIKWWKHYGGAISSRDWLDFFNIREEDLE